MAEITGYVQYVNGRPAAGALIKAFDRDMRSVWLLGEGVADEDGRYALTYEARQYEHAEKGSADVFVRAASADGKYSGESGLYFDVPDEVTIDLILALEEPKPGEPPLSELERLAAELTPLMENVAPADLTHEDIKFLARESNERRIRIELWRAAARLARGHDIPVAAGYGWGRRGLLPLTVEYLLEQPPDRLREALEEAIDQEIIPDISRQIPAISDRLNALQFASGRLVRRRFVGRLLDEVSGRPLSGRLVEAVDLGGEDGSRSLGSDTTDGRGAFLLNITGLSDLGEDATHRLRITVRDEERVVGETELETPVDQKEAADVRVRLLDDGRGKEPIAAVASPALTVRLAARGHHTLRDIINTPDLNDEEDPEGLKRVRGAATWTALANLDETQRDGLLDAGLFSPLEVAGIPRPDFVARHSESFRGEAEAYAFHQAALDNYQLFSSMVGTALIGSYAGPDGGDDDPDLPPNILEILGSLKTCGCKDCDSAVSPAAYLAHLLKWLLVHLKDGTNAITLPQLEEGEHSLHQPFGDLVADCHAVEEQVRQARMACEGLWRFTQLLELADLVLPISVRTGYRQFRNDLYRLILANLGVPFEQLLKALLEVVGDTTAAETVAEMRQSVAGRLGINEADLIHFFFNVLVDTGPTVISPTEEELQDLFGWRNTRMQTSDFFKDLPEPELLFRQRLRLREIWRDQDWFLDDAYNDIDPANRLPFVDPEINSEEDMREGPNPALDLLLARREALAQHRAGMLSANPQDGGLDGFVTLVEGELGQPVSDLQHLHAAVHGTDAGPLQIEQANEMLAALFLTQAGLTHLIEVHDRLATGQPLGATEDEIDEVWTIVFDILSRAFRHSLFPQWVDEEELIDLTLGPNLFWPLLGEVEAPNQWQAGLEERCAWEAALARRSSHPAIHPYQISLAFFKYQQQSVVFVDTWQARRDWIDVRLDAVAAAREGQPTQLDELRAMLAASTSGISVSTLEELDNREQAGDAFQKRLDQLTLSLAGYRVMSDTLLLAQAGDVSSDIWDALLAIVVDVEVKREFADWRADEQEDGIFRDPGRFLIPEPLPSPADTPQALWLHDAPALRQWVATVEGRTAQMAAQKEALAQAVSDAEEVMLVELRDGVLIPHANIQGNSLVAKAEALGKRLLLDMRMDGCHMTTRVSQAILTLQALLRGVYTQEHPEEFQHLVLETTADFEAVWPVLGSYPTWRAFLLVFLFPENVLDKSPAPKPSYGFEQLKKNLPINPTQEDACKVARAFGKYFHDVYSLKVQATCQIKTFLNNDETCESTGTATPTTLHLFARSHESGRIYWASLHPAWLGDTTTSWEPVHEIGVVEQIFGATPHFTPNGKRYVLLFFSVRNLGKMELKFAAYDVDGGGWSEGGVPLGLPPGGEDGFSAAVIQKRGADVDFESGDLGFPTFLAVKPTNGAMYINQVNQEAVDLETESWKPLFGPRMIDSFGKVHALIQRGFGEYVIVAERVGPLWGLDYRFLHLPGIGVDRDDLTWSKLTGQSDQYRGGFAWSTGVATFLFYEDNQKTLYRRLFLGGPIKPEDESDFRYNDLNDLNADPSAQAQQAAEEIVSFNDEWLVPNVGVSLEDYTIADFVPNFFVPHIDEKERVVNGEINIDPINPDHGIKEVGKDEGFVFYPITLNLLELFEYKLTPGDIAIPEEALFKKVSELSFYEVQIKHRFIEKFIQYIAEVDSSQELKGMLRQWKFVDEQIKQFSYEGLTLKQLIGRFRDNVIKPLANTFSGGIFTGPTPTSFRERDRSNELSSDFTASNTDAVFVSTSGDEKIVHTLPDKVAVIQKNNGCFWTRMDLEGNELITKQKLLQLTPYGTGPFDMMPERDLKDLQQRAAEIKEMYEPLKDKRASVQRYLKEAYRFIPLFLGRELQSGGNYEEALLWYRQVLDYLQSAADRKIDYGLKLEEELAWSYEDAAEWLDDPSNPHAIAATRKNTYTRQILLLIIRCLIESADARFSRDTASDIARARELYTLALRLLDSKELKPGQSPCGNILGELEIDVVEPLQLPLGQLVPILDQIPDPDGLRGVVDAVVAVSLETDRPAGERVADIGELVFAAVVEFTPPETTYNDVFITDQNKANMLQELYLAHRPARELLQKTHKQGRQKALAQLSQATGASAERLLSEDPPDLAWLREPGPNGTGGGEANGRIDVSRFDPAILHRLGTLDQIRLEAPATSLAIVENDSVAISTGLSFAFCIPQNPVVEALRRRAENNLTKLRTCRNIAGFLRELDPYGTPIGIGSGLVSADGAIFSGIVEAAPTHYRYAVLIDRAKQLVTIAQQIEAGYQTALEKAENEEYNVMLAEQQVELANARVVLGDLRVTQANSQLGLAKLQKNSAALRENTYAGWIAAGKNEHEMTMLAAYSDAADAHKQAARASAAASVAQASAQIAGAWSLHKAGDFVTGVAVAQTAALGTSIASTLAAAVFQEKAIEAEAQAQSASFEASFERQNDEWRFQQGMAALDKQIGGQEIQLARDGIAIAGQERVIVSLEQTHAVDLLRFLISKVFNEEMYRWMAEVLADVYRFFLQSAAAIARLAAQQLSFERQQGPLKLIQSDYWETPEDSGGNRDRLGLTGSASLLKDIYQLDNIAFETKQRKQPLTLVLKLAELFPFEFQLFRETGVLLFNTSLELINRQMPGYYLCLIQQVTVSVVALIPPTRGTRATLTSGGISRVVVGGDTFPTVTLRHKPERIALTGAVTSSATTLELVPEGQSLLHPFEGSGLETAWELRMPKAANPFDYNTIADVLLAVDLTALHSYDYERAVIEQMDRHVSANRPFYFRQDFSDAWYDLNNPDLTGTPMIVSFETKREDFPPNLLDLRIEHVLLYFVGAGGESAEAVVDSFTFSPESNPGALGGSAVTVGGVISTRRGNGAAWTPIIGQEPFGEWVLALDDTPEIRALFEDEACEDILFVLTYIAETLAWPD